MRLNETRFSLTARAGELIPRRDAHKSVGRQIIITDPSFVTGILVCVLEMMRARQIELGEITVDLMVLCEARIMHL
jgi:prephenate dehydratase